MSNCTCKNCECCKPKVYIDDDFMNFIVHLRQAQLLYASSDEGMWGHVDSLLQRLIALAKIRTKIVEDDYHFFYEWDELLEKLHAGHNQACDLFLTALKEKGYSND